MQINNQLEMTDENQLEFPKMTKKDFHRTDIILLIKTFSPIILKYFLIGIKRINFFLKLCRKIRFYESNYSEPKQGSWSPVQDQSVVNVRFKSSEGVSFHCDGKRMVKKRCFFGFCLEMPSYIAKFFARVT